MDTQPERVAFTDGQGLRTRDLRDEQAHHLGAARRHNVSAHSWGLVRGLEVVVRDNLAVVTFGLAVDPLGRVLELAADTPLPEFPLADARNRKDAPHGVWLRYAERPVCH